MPLLNFHIIEGRDQAQLTQLLDAAHEAMVTAFGVADSDRYQCVTQHRLGELIVRDTDLGYKRTRDVVLLSVVSRPRPQEQKLNFYLLLAKNLHSACGLRPDDLIVSLVENTDSDWSFGQGKAEFISGELK